MLSLTFLMRPTCLRSHTGSSDVVLAPVAAECPVTHWQSPAEGRGFQADGPSLHPHPPFQLQNLRARVSFDSEPPHPPHRCCWMCYCSAHRPLHHHRCRRRHHQSCVFFSDAFSSSSLSLSPSSFPSGWVLSVKTATRTEPFKHRTNIQCKYYTSLDFHLIISKTTKNKIYQIKHSFSPP